MLPEDVMIYVRLLWMGENERNGKKNSDGGGGGGGGKE